MDDYTYKNLIPFDFEDHFNYKTISPEHVSFARHYIENKMGIDMDSCSNIEFSSISPTVFGYLVAHIALTYEGYSKEKPETGFNTLPPDVV